MHDLDEKAQKKRDRKFATLPEEWRNQMMASNRSDVEIDSEIKKAAVSLVNLELAKALDEDLIALREQLQVAQSVYTEGKKENLIRIEFLIDVLRSRGRDVPSVQSYIKSAKED
jgi:hypothetical protein